ncbi:MAG: hypothetical protein ACOYMF_18325 [Bacteroidales bacterium]
MALTIVQQPPAIIAALMPVVFRIQTDYTGLCHLRGMVGTLGDSIEPNALHQVTFEFSDYLRDKPVLPATLTLPAVHASACPAQTFEFSEVYGTPPTEHNESAVSNYRILAAKVPHWKHNFTGTIYSYISATLKPFLTWYPNRQRKVLSSETVHLFHLVTNAATYYVLQIQFVVTFTDGTTATFDGTATPGDLTDYKIVQFDVSPAIVLAWATTNHPTKTVVSYTAQSVFHTTGDPVLLSELRSFIINTLPFENTRQLVFRNSFGTFDQILLRGSATITATTDRLSANREANYETAAVPDRVTWYNKGRQMLTAETGYMLAAEREWLNELLNSTEIYEKQSSVLVPIELRTEKFIQHTDDYQLMSVSFEFEYLQTPSIEIQ